MVIKVVNTSKKINLKKSVFNMSITSKSFTLGGIKVTIIFKIKNSPTFLIVFNFIIFKERKINKRIKPLTVPGVGRWKSFSKRTPK